MRTLVIAILAVLTTAPAARAHLMAGRRPLDVLVAKSAAAGFAAVVGAAPGAANAGGTPAARLRITACAKGPCPAGPFTAAAESEHGAAYREGTPVFVFLAGGPGAWRTVATEGEARALASAEPADVRAYVARYAAVQALPAARREAAYVEALLDQAAAPARWLQEDALQSLLRVPPAAASAAALERLLQAAAKTRFENVRLGAFIVADGWRPAALRRFLAAMPLDAWEPGVRARALLYLGNGDTTERALPCRYTAAPEPPVRAAAVASCTPAAAWVPLCLSALADPAPEVRRSARARLRANPAARAEVTAWALGRLPWWERVYYRVAGKEPGVVSEIFTPAGAARP
jgi:hypothetical protein